MDRIDGLGKVCLVSKDEANLEGIYPRDGGLPPNQTVSEGSLLALTDSCFTRTPQICRIALIYDFIQRHRSVNLLTTLSVKEQEIWPGSLCALKPDRIGTEWRRGVATPWCMRGRKSISGIVYPFTFQPKN